MLVSAFAITVIDLFFKFDIHKLRDKRAYFALEFVGRLDLFDGKNKRQDFENKNIKNKITPNINIEH